MISNKKIKYRKYRSTIGKDFSIFFDEEEINNLVDLSSDLWLVSEL